MNDNNNADDGRIIGVAINGAQIDLTNAPLWKWFRSGYVLATLCVIVFVMAFFDPASTPVSAVAANVTAAFWIGVVVFYLVMVTVSINLIAFIYQRIGWHRIYLPALSVVWVNVLMNFGEVFMSLLVQQTLEWRMPKYNMFLFYYVMEQIFLTLYVSVIHPIVLRDVDGADVSSANPAKDDSGGKSLIRIEKSFYDIDDLYYLKAAEHYLHVTTSHREDLVRARLSEIAAELGSDAGIQIHRSYWVAKAAISSAYMYSPKLYIVMIDGAEFSVARNRIKVVLEWLELNSIMVKDS